MSVGREQPFVIINDDGDIFPSLEALKSWQKWASIKAEHMRQQGEYPTQQGAMGILDQSVAHQAKGFDD